MLHKRSVLIVDDDVDSRDAIGNVARDEGFEVREASNGLEALESICEGTPDLVLLDLLMPIIDGQQVIQMLRAARWDLRIVVMTASAITLPEGVEHFRKPISLEQLLHVLEGVSE
jgi:two-component system response regulator (stage 0 sporulation protein F)